MQSDIIKLVEEALVQIRPYLQSDGGNIELVKVTPDKKVYVRLVGACENCSMSAQTLRNGVEAAIRRAVPDVKAVIAV